jgi:hypothetical protein
MGPNPARDPNEPGSLKNPTRLHIRTEDEVYSPTRGQANKVTGGRVEGERVCGFTEWLVTEFDFDV